MDTFTIDAVVDRAFILVVAFDTDARIGWTRTPGKHHQAEIRTGDHSIDVEVGTGKKARILAPGDEEKTEILPIDATISIEVAGAER